MNELSNELTNVVVSYTLPKIAYDLKDVKEQVEFITTKYQGLVMSEDDIPQMKKDIAELNKLSKAIDSKRKGVVKDIKAPLKCFEDELKVIVNHLDTTYRSIKDQIDSFTEEQKAWRRAEIVLFEEWKDYLTFDERWLNKGKSDISIKEDMNYLKSIYDNNVTMIETTCKMVELESSKYIQLLQDKRDINDIVNIIQNDKLIKEKYSQPKEEVKVVVEEIKENSPKHVETYFITANETQHELLQKFMLDNKIEYQINEEGLF